MTQYHIEIMQQLGDGQSYERNRIVHEARLYMAQSTEAMLEASKQLIILEENKPHGDFAGIVEEQLGLYVRAAQRMMKTSLKYPPPELEPEATTLSLLGRAELSELVTGDDDDLAELVDGGTAAGLTSDDVDRMSVRELRRALHEAREANAAQQRVLADKNEKIDSLSIRLEKESRIQPSEPDGEMKKLRAEVTMLTVEAESTIAVRLSNAFEALCACYVENVIDTPRDFMADLVCQLESIARSPRSTSDLPNEPVGNTTPLWLTEPTS